MYIKRDTARSVFREDRRPQRRSLTRLLFLVGLMAGALLVYVSANFDRLQAQAIDALGMGPTPTPLPSDLATLADQLRLEGDLPAARDLFERAIAQRPENVNYLYEYGELLIDLGDPETAITLGDEVIQLAPDDPRGYALKGRAQVWSGRAAQAVPTVLAGLSLEQGFTSPLYAVLARAYTTIGEYEDGVEAGATAVQADPMNADSRRAYAYALSWVSANAEATAQLEAAIVIDPRNIDAHLELALQYLAQDRDQDAINLYDQVLAMQPRNAQALRRLCGAYRKIGEFERAIGYCQDATSADPQSVGAHYELGILQYNRFDFEGARASFGACVELDPGSLACKHRLGLTLIYLGECDAAWETLQDSLLMAQVAQSDGQNVSGIVENIQQGLILIGQTCPGYGALAPTATPDAEATPQLTPPPADSSQGS